MIIEFWTCKCENKRNANGIKQCRKCGAVRQEYTTDGESIVPVRKSSSASAKQRPEAIEASKRSAKIVRKLDTAQDRHKKHGSFIQSTLKGSTDK